MPIYEYLCHSCHHRFEAKQRVSDPPLHSCARCGQAVTKVISAPAIMFKGSGWYVTDYSDKLKPPSQPESTAKPADGQKEGKSETVSPAPAAAPSAGSSDPSAGTSSSTASAVPTPSTSSSSSS
ncbi:MAG TPA: FmdB family zinc ribbon protein [Nitrospiraceae bacterium]|nr:FmdB family zinc ribbon protein [Nitrospiraceae bacterium]